MKFYKLSVATLLAVGGSLSSSANAQPIFDKEVACYKALIGHSEGKNYNLQKDLILIPATRSGKKGFYLYTDSGAYFHAVPATKSGGGAIILNCMSPIKNHATSIIPL